MMTAAMTVRPRAITIGAPERRCFVLSFQPQGMARGQVLYIPPFAEEMNRCRSLVATVARQLAGSGYGCTVLDLFGTGDSDGEFQDASLQDWLGDVAQGVDWVREEFGAVPVLWGVRLGALLAWEYARTHSGAVQALLLMQPVTSGRLLTRQLVRQRLAGALARKGEDPETAEDITARWQRGDTVEIGGYGTRGSLMLALQDLIISAENAPDCAVQWLEHESTAGKGLSPVSAKIVAAMQERGAPVEVHPFSGAAFWQLNERAQTPELEALMAELYP